jgi:hypothetical protein
LRSPVQVVLQSEGGVAVARIWVINVVFAGVRLVHTFLTPRVCCASPPIVPAEEGTLVPIFLLQFHDLLPPKLAVLALLLPFHPPTLLQ